MSHVTDNAAFTEFMTYSKKRLLVLCIALMMPSPGIFANGNDYEEQRVQAVQNCEVIDPREHQSGLFFNPDGYRSYYLQSQCFQSAAITFRDIGLCEKVRQRRALFSSSWGYSENNCAKLVEKAITDDRRVIDQMRADYEQGHVSLSDFTVERNGNGRDIDIIPTFSGAGKHGYRLVFEIISEDASLPPVLLKSSGFYLDGHSNNIRIYVPQAEVRRRFTGFSMDRPWQVRATLVYTTGTGSYGGKWSDAFIESRFPERARTQVMVKTVNF
jgi:hypothetical protein